MSAARGRHRQRAVMASDAEWTRIARNAEAAGMEQSRYVLDLVRGDAPGGEAPVPSAEEGRALMERVRGIEETLHGALRDPLPECAGLTLAEALALLARERRR